MKINIQFDRNWFFAQESHMLSIKKVIALLRNEVDDKTEVIEKSLNECVLELPSIQDSEATDQKIRSLISGKICQVDGNNVPYTLTRLDGKLDAKQESFPTPAPQKPLQTQAPEHSDVQQAAEHHTLDDLNSLVGVTEFKQLCQEIRARAQLIRTNRTQDVFLSTVYLFVGNEGFGCEKAISILDALLREESLFSPTASPFELRLSSPPEPLTDANLSRVFSSPRLVTINLSNVLDRTHSPEFKRLMMDMFHRGKKSLMVFRAPYMGREKTRQIVEDLRDVLSVRQITFPPFTDVELQELAERTLAGYSFSAAPDVWDLFQKKIEQESMDGYFYGVHTVRKIVNEMIQSQERLWTEKREMEVRVQQKRITAEAIQKLLDPEPVESEEGLEQLERMIGMSDVAKQVREIIRLVQLYSTAAPNERPAMHMCFTGNPGTGKTTVARIIGKAMKDAGILRIGKFFEHHSRDLCGQYVGHTAPLTTSICQEAYGSVLFLDEAYALVTSDSPRDYGHEAMDTLIAQMENHRDDFIVIFAGYPQEMERFLDANPGMRTRIPYHIHFPNYTQEELFDIFRLMAERRFQLGNGFLDQAKRYFLALPKALLESRNFGNGRFVRNLFERICSKAAMRNVGASIQDMILEIEDFDAASAEIQLPKQQSAARIGF